MVALLEAVRSMNPEFEETAVQSDQEFAAASRGAGLMGSIHPREGGLCGAHRTS
jgi:hypothetical protein